MRKFKVGDVVRVKEKTRKEVMGLSRRTWQRRDWVGTVRSYERGFLPYGVQPGNCESWAWFYPRELDLIERPKKGAK